jgi:hypothetical protein
MEAVHVVLMSLGEIDVIWVSAVAMDIDVIPMGAMTTTWRDEG